eukprot:6457436-Amphidinium_carterae.2
MASRSSQPPICARCFLPVWRLTWFRKAKVQNGAGLKHSDMYGFGLLDVGAAVFMARDWPASASYEHALLAKYAGSLA